MLPAKCKFYNKAYAYNMYESHWEHVCIKLNTYLSNGERGGIR